ncbi:MAG TPA: ATP-binding protein [Solirubrobacteraceae bacterium]
MKRRDGILALFAAVLLLALLSVFAIELSNTQAKSKRDVESRVHERGLLAAALVDSLFQTVTSQIPQDSKLYGGQTVSTATMNARAQRNTYLALLDGSGQQVIAASRGFTPQARANLAHSAALALIRGGHAYGLGNLLPYGNIGVINLAVVFPTKFGNRILLTGFGPQTLGSFITSDLRKIPGVQGAHNYLIDGNDTVLASTNPARPVGYVFRQPSKRAALSQVSGTSKGHYYDSVPLSNSTERIVLSAPTGPLFASVTGLRRWIPWAIFGAFALVAILALELGRRVLRSAAAVRATNEQLESVNDELESVNSTLERRAVELGRSNAELEQFASIASHDLQEPLRKVRTFTQQLTVTDADNLSEKGRQYLERANAAAERMQRLIEDLLKFSRVATHGRAFHPVDLSEVVDGVLEDLELEVERSGAVVRVGELPTIDGDEFQLRQLMQNLISNALKFRREDVVPEVDIDARAKDAAVEITVRDNGIGFEPQYAGRIFRVFERLHGRSRYQGTGIGLALCRKIAERHGGTIEADSEPGVGSTFTVRLPVHPRADSFAGVTANGGATELEGAHAGV